MNDEIRYTNLSISMFFEVQIAVDRQLKRSKGVGIFQIFHVLEKMQLKYKIFKRILKHQYFLEKIEVKIFLQTYHDFIFKFYHCNITKFYVL